MIKKKNQDDYVSHRLRSEHFSFNQMSLAFNFADASWRILNEYVINIHEYVINLTMILLNTQTHAWST